VWSDKTAYIGYWSNGEKDGSGKLIKPNGEELDGIWSKGKRLQSSKDRPSSLVNGVEKG
jgi:hypothetical protein